MFLQNATLSFCLFYNQSNHCILHYLEIIILKFRTMYSALGTFLVCSMYSLSITSVKIGQGGWMDEKLITNSLVIAVM